MENVDEFIAKYNMYLALKVGRYENVKLIERIDRNASRMEPIDYFLSCFSFPNEYQYSGFVFESDAGDLPPCLVHFGTHVDYSLLYVLNKETGWVGLWSYESEGVEMYCSDSIGIFFKCMAIIMQVKTELIKHFDRTGNFDIDREYINKNFTKCMALNENNSEFQEFYIHILNVDDGEL